MTSASKPPFQFGLWSLFYWTLVIAAYFAVRRAGDTGALLIAIAGMIIGIGGLICVAVHRLLRRRRL